MGIYNIGKSELKVGDRVIIYTSLPSTKRFREYGIPEVSELLSLMDVSCYITTTFAKGESAVLAVKRIEAEVGVDGLYYVSQDGSRNEILTGLLNFCGTKSIFIVKAEDTKEVKKFKAGDIVMGTIEEWKLWHYSQTSGAVMGVANDLFVMTTATKGISLTNYSTTGSLEEYGSVVGVKLSSINGEIGGKIKPIQDYVAAKQIKKEEVKKSVTRVAGDVYRGSGSKVYVYLGDYKIDVDLCSYAQYSAMLGVADGYNEVQSRYLVINTSKNTGKELYDKLISGCLSGTDIGDYLAQTGIKLGYCYEGSFWSVDEYLRDYMSVLGGDYLDKPLTLRGIESNLTQRKFKELVGNYAIPFTGVVNLMKKRSSRDLLFKFV